MISTINNNRTKFVQKLKDNKEENRKKWIEKKKKKNKNANARKPMTKIFYK